MKLLSDIFFVSLLIFVSLILINFYFSGSLLNTGYSDWLAQAFKVKQLETYGLQPWTHSWANGVNIWRAYQFIPHIITLLFSQFFNVSITRAMVLLTITQFVLLRIFIYFALRYLKVSPIASFLCSIISFDIPHYWKAVGDYSYLFGVTVFPLTLLLWIQYFKGKIQYFFPFLAGISFYLHPVLAIYSFFLWVVGIVFSSRKVLTLSTFFQFIIFLISSSIFWLPITFFKQPYAYTNSTFSSLDWFQKAIYPYSYFGLSLFIFGYAFLTGIFILFFAKHTKAWMRPLFLFTTLMIGLVIVGNSTQLPRFITQTQVVRGIIILGIMLIFSFAPVLDYLLKTKFMIIKILTAVIFSLMFVESINFTSNYAPTPFKDYDDPVLAFSKTGPNFANETHRVWSPRIDASSYYAPSNIFLADSYNGHLDSNPIPARLNMLINYQPFNKEVPVSNLDRLENYFKVTGTEYLFFDEVSAFTKTLSEDKKTYINLGQIELPYSAFHVFKVPWVVRNAVIIDESLSDQLNHFPFTLNIDNSIDQLNFDEYIKKFSKIIYDERNTILSITYPSQTSLKINIPAGRNSNLIYINESYDTNWKAYFNNQQQPIRPIGPNYMLVSLSSKNKSGTLILENTWPSYFYFSLVLIAMLPTAIIIFSGIGKFNGLLGKERK